MLIIITSSITLKVLIENYISLPRENGADALARL
jgi:hypothetical protein